MRLGKTFVYNLGVLFNNGKKILCLWSKHKNCHVMEDNNDIKLYQMKIFPSAIDSQKWSRLYFCICFLVLLTTVSLDLK